tara:strand:+ start:1242 stop:1934 length:693 start_codon:yes stop_codon:yes gene_type:complete
MPVILSFDIGIRNLAYCLARWDVNEGDTTVQLPRCETLALDTEVLALGVIDVTTYLDPGPPIRNINKIQILKLARALIRALDANVPCILTKVDTIDHVIIENQPCMKNPRMKSVQMLLFGYFVKLGLLDSAVIQNACMFQPRDKLTVYVGEPVECNLKSKYGRRKRLSIEYTRRMLMSNEKASDALAIFENEPKKDDIADAYLQALTFIRQRFLKKQRKRVQKRHMVVSI